MRREMLKFNLFSMALLGLFSVADDVTLQSVESISHGNKTSVILEYSGTDKLQFFAIDGVNGAITLDFPGVVNQCDVSAIHSAQLKRVEAIPLDPESSKGVGLHFYPKTHVDFAVFEGEPGQLVLLFEEVAPPSTVAAQAANTVPKPEAPQPSPETVASPPLADEAPQHVVVPGISGEQRLSSLELTSQAQALHLQLGIEGDFEYSTFELPNPKRFCVDLKGVVFGLLQQDITLDSGLARKVRASQFQVEPEAITRLVVDLYSDAEAAIERGPQGLTLTLAKNATGMDSAPWNAWNASPPQAVEPSPEPQVAVQASPEPQPQADSAQNPQLPVDSLGDETVSPEIAQADIETPPQVSPSQILLETVDVADPAPLPARDEALLQAFEGDVSETQMIADVPEFTESEDALPVLEVSPEPAVASTPPLLEMTDSAQLQATHPADEPRIALPEPADLQRNAFVQSSEPTFFSEMKNTKANRTRPSVIHVTNHTIESSKRLRESRDMQADDILSYGQEASLFEQMEAHTDPDAYEQISGGQKKYRGFEIQKIDVKDANVVDLLRFLADQVGFNLYVDPSVQNLKATYSFRNIPWDQAMDIILRNANLDWDFENGVLRVATTTKFKQEAEDRRLLAMEKELSVPPETVTFPLSYAKVAEVVPIVEQYLSPRGTILQDERTNTLIIEDIPKRMVAIRTLIRRLDTRVPQVSIESRIVETTRRFLKELGIQWGVSAEYYPEIGTQTGLDFPNRVGVGGPRNGTRDANTALLGGYAVNFPVVEENPSGIGLSLGNFLNNLQLDISLQMLEDSGLGQIISAPKVTTQNNKTAYIKNGQRIPIQTVQRGTITVRYIDAVLILEVTPHITSEKTIIMDVVVDKSEPDFTRTVLGNPVINVRRAETRVLVKDGGTTVIGGIFVLNEQESNTGIPGLRKVPVVKRLFSHDLDSYQNQELLIFITPRIIKY